MPLIIENMGDAMRDSFAQLLDGLPAHNAMFLAVLEVHILLDIADWKAKICILRR